MYNATLYTIRINDFRSTNAEQHSNQREKHIQTAVSLYKFKSIFGTL